jgi:diguanylate cyclase (GGDEF)-like protein
MIIDPSGVSVTSVSWTVGPLLTLIVVLLASSISLAVQLRRARRTIEALTLVDTVTGLGNRHLLELEVPRELGRARRAGHWLFAAVVNVDRMDAFNRSAGRPAGHALLAGIGAVLRGSLRRAGDHTFRSGGDEFLFAFASEHKHDGAAMAERIRTRVAELATFHPGNPPHGFVTVSLGLVTVAPGVTTTLAAVEERCAEALALARKEGRNRTAGLTLEGERIATADGVRLAGESDRSAVER